MDRIFKLHWFGNNEITENQIFTMAFLIVIVFVLSILIFIAVKRQKANKTPNAAILMVESMITKADNYASDLSENRLDKANPFFISLFIFLFFGNLLSLFGLAPLGSALSAVLAATFVVWLTTMGLNLIYQKFSFLIKLINPLEVAGNFSPLISLTFRMFGNIVGGVVLITLLHAFLNNIWIKIIKVDGNNPLATINPAGILITPFLNLYFDLFAGAIQAFVFMTLTISYWMQAAEVSIKEKHKKKIKEWKKEVLKRKEARLSAN
ncbi:F0F1 ATP synthase subunit A [Metamycoplasma buccale]|uniref:F0F1 ATP synthase subunit A n=1 Tax=Metamycoplasma buccale TaxID=55602 RepID=UPI00398E8E61